MNVFSALIYLQYLQIKRSWIHQFLFYFFTTDNEPPQAICRSPDTVYNNAHYIQPLISVEWITPVFHDNSGQFVNVTASHRSGDMMPLGSTNVEYIAADYFGNEKRCIVMVNVRRKYSVSHTEGSVTGWYSARCGLVMMIPLVFCWMNQLNFITPTVTFTHPKHYQHSIIITPQRAFKDVPTFYSYCMIIAPFPLGPPNLSLESCLYLFII